MRKRQQKHVIDMLFIISLLFLFILSSLMLIGLGASVYRRNTASSSSHYNSRTAFSYLTQKIRQADLNGNISLSEMEGQKAICLRNESGVSTYDTLLYCLDGNLTELTMEEGSSLPASAGQKILEVKDFSVSMLQDNLMRIEVTQLNGEKTVLQLNIRSRKGADHASSDSE